MNRASIVENPYNIEETFISPHIVPNTGTDGEHLEAVGHTLTEKEWNVSVSAADYTVSAIQGQASKTFDFPTMVNYVVINPSTRGNTVHLRLDGAIWRTHAGILYPAGMYRVAGGGGSVMYRIRARTNYHMTLAIQLPAGYTPTYDDDVTFIAGFLPDGDRAWRHVQLSPLG